MQVCQSLCYFFPIIYNKAQIKYTCKKLCINFKYPIRYENQTVLIQLLLVLIRGGVRITTSISFFRTYEGRITDRERAKNSLYFRVKYLCNLYIY